MEKNRIAQEIESVFAKLQHGEKSYSKGEFYKEYFFIRSDLALVILNKKNEILISFADHTPPSNAALYSLLLDDIESTMPIRMLHIPPFFVSVNRRGGKRHRTRVAKVTARFPASLPG